MSHASPLLALIFDQDGVIIDTERDGHRVAFNRAFAEFDIPLRWNVEEYGVLARIGGGKERMRRSFAGVGLFSDLREDELDARIRAIHARKTELMVEILRSGSLPLRPGVHRLMAEARDAGMRLAICTTSNEENTRAIVDTLLPDIPFDAILAGDVVSRKKPDPEIYRLALERLGLDAAQALVIEDSRTGVQAARSAGLRVVATVTDYTREEDLEGADPVLSSLGNRQRGARVMRSKRLFAPGSVVRLADLMDYVVQS